MNFEDIMQQFGNNNSQDGGGSGFTLFDPMTLIEPLMPFIIGLIVIGVLMTLAVIISAVNAYRAQQATIEIRNILREMNQRQKNELPVVTTTDNNRES